jgi:hypothetical protein
LQDEHLLWVFVADEVQKVGGEGMKPGEMNKNKPEQIGNQQIHKLEQIRFSHFCCSSDFFKMGISTKPKSGVQRKSGIFYPTIMWISDKEGDMSSQPGDSTHRNWLKPLVN